VGVIIADAAVLGRGRQEIKVLNRARSLPRQLPGAGRTLLQLPLVTEEHLEVAAIQVVGLGFQAPSIRCGGKSLPCRCRNGCCSPAPCSSMLAASGGGHHSAQDSPAPGPCRKVWRAGNQGHGFLVVHRHAGKGFAHIATRSQPDRAAIGGPLPRFT